jgi:hypothetical protein
MATWRATGGTAEGFAAFDKWSQKSKKYDSRTTVSKWSTYFSSPPTEIGAGTVIYSANEADPGWGSRYDAAVMAGLEAAAAAACGPAAMAKAEISSGVPNETPDATDEQPRAEAELPPMTGDSNESPARVSDKPKDEKPKESGKRQLLFSSAEFVSKFVPPDYLVNGLMLHKNVYALTGRTGDGKTAVALRIAAHVAVGLPIAGMEVEKGRVVFFAGENPDDVRARWIKLCEEMKLDPDDMNVFFLVGTPPISTDQIRGMIEADVAVCGPVTLLIVDTSAAYYSGNDENDNKQMGEHARMLRSFVNLKGGPTILVTCHPTKNPDMSNLLPRGGGAFTAEIDGNLVAIRERGSMLVEIDTHGKFRGPEFAPFSFKLVSATSDKLRDSKGRLIWTVFAAPVAEAERAAMEEAGDRKRNDLLRAMASRPACSIHELAVALGWNYKNGEPNRSLVQRLMASLAKDKLVEKKGQRYVITPKGRSASSEADDEAM